MVMLAIRLDPSDLDQLVPDHKRSVTLLSVGMKLNPLERAVLRRFLEDEGVGAALDLDSIEVVSREFTGTGFFADSLTKRNCTFSDPARKAIAATYMLLSASRRLTSGSSSE